MMRDTYGAMVPSSYKMSSKTEAVLDTVEDIVTNGDKVVIFSKFKTCVYMIAEDIRSKLKQNVLLYTGEQTEEERDDALKKFWTMDTYNIIIGTEAMSTGLNIQIAKYVINIDQPDTLAIKTQRIGRVRRAGSTFDNVIIYDMITSDGNNARSKDIERLENIANNQDVTDALVTIDDSQREALIKAMKE